MGWRCASRTALRAELGVREVDGGDAWTIDVSDRPWANPNRHPLSGRPSPPDPRHLQSHPHHGDLDRRVAPRLAPYAAPTIREPRMAQSTRRSADHERERSTRAFPSPSSLRSCICRTSHRRVRTSSTRALLPPGRSEATGRNSAMPSRRPARRRCEQRTSTSSLIPFWRSSMEHPTRTPIWRRHTSICWPISIGIWLGPNRRTTPGPTSPRRRCATLPTRPRSRNDVTVSATLCPTSTTDQSRRKAWSSSRCSCR